jgi:hypothetical protein
LAKLINILRAATAGLKRVSANSNTPSPQMQDWHILIVSEDIKKSCQIINGVEHDFNEYSSVRNGGQNFNATQTSPRIVWDPQVAIDANYRSDHELEVSSIAGKNKIIITLVSFGSFISGTVNALDGLFSSNSGKKGIIFHFDEKNNNSSSVNCFNRLDVVKYIVVNSITPTIALLADEGPLLLAAYQDGIPAIIEAKSDYSASRLAAFLERLNGIANFALYLETEFKHPITFSIQYSHYLNKDSGYSCFDRHVNSFASDLESYIESNSSLFSTYSCSNMLRPILGYTSSEGCFTYTQNVLSKAA